MCRALVFVGARLDQRAHNFKVPALSCYEKRRCPSNRQALAFAGTRLHQKAHNFKVPFVSCNVKRCHSINRQALVFVGTSLHQKLAAMKRGVAPLSVRPWSWLAPASSSRSTHLRFPFEAATYRGVHWFASSKLGFVAWFKFCARSLSSFSSHATMMSRLCSASGGRNSRITSCTTVWVKVWSSIKVWLSSSAKLSWSDDCQALFQGLPEPSARSTASKNSFTSHCGKHF